MDAFPYLFACLLVYAGMFLFLLLDPVEAALCLIWVVALIIAALKDWSAVSRVPDPVWEAEPKREEKDLPSQDA